MELTDKKEINGNVYYKICTTEELEDSGKFEFEINFEKVVLIREKGKLYCFSRICPHMRRESMQKGLVRGNYIICPLHGHSFNLETGIPADRSKSTKDLKKFDVLQTDDAIYVKEPEEERPAWADNW